MIKHAKQIAFRHLALAMAVSCAISGCSEPPSPASDVVESRAAAKPDVGGVESVSIEAEGRGATVMGAVASALLVAVAQVNGTAVDATTTSIEAGLSLSDGDETIQLHARAFQEAIRTRTKGMVTAFKLLEKEQDDNVWVVKVEAQIAKYVRSEAASRVRVAVAMPRLSGGTVLIDDRPVPGAEIARQFRQGLVDSLTSSNRFTVLDREFDAELDVEIGRIQSGNIAPEDMARLGQELATDLLWVGTIDRFEYPRHEKAMRTRDKAIYWYDGGAAISYRLINVATRQVMYSGSAKIQLPESEPSLQPEPVLVEKMVEHMKAHLLGQISQRVIQQMFPVTVVSRTGNSVVLSQGEGVVQSGKRYRVIYLGDELKDPQTGQSLGRVEKHCCEVLISRVSTSTSYGELENVAIQLEDPLIPGSLMMTEALMEPVALIANSARDSASEMKNPAAEASSDDFALEEKPSAAKTTKEQPAAPTKTAAPSTDNDW